MVDEIVRVLTISATKFMVYFIVLALLLPATGAFAAPIEQEIDELGTTIEKKQGESISAQEDVAVLQADLEQLIAEYQEAHGKLDELDEATAKKERELNSIVVQQLYYQKLLNQLNVFTYRNGDTYFFEVVLGTSSFKDLIVRIDYLAKLNQRQSDILQSTKRLRETVIERRDELATEKARQRQMVNALQEKQGNINGLLERHQQLIDTLGKDIETLKTEKQRKEARKIALEAAGKAYGGNFNSQLDMIFPVASGYTGSYINDWGFRRAGNPSGHQGTDIFGLKGTPLIAVADGVIGEDFGNSRIGGYRLHIIDRQGVDYYYAHLNNDSPGTDDGLGGARTAFAPGIGPGVRVRQGQVVGYMGDSGDAEPTPPHVHFGIQVNGNYVNPFPYLKAAQYR